MLASFRATSLRPESGRFRNASRPYSLARFLVSRTVRSTGGKERSSDSYAWNCADGKRRLRMRTSFDFPALRLEETEPPETACAHCRCDDALATPSCHRVTVYVGRAARRVDVGVDVDRTRCTYYFRNVGTRGFPGGGMFTNIQLARLGLATRALRGGALVVLVALTRHSRDSVSRVGATRRDGPVAMCPPPRVPVRCPPDAAAWQ